MTADFEQMWRDLAPVGRSSSSGGYDRSPFRTAEREATAWFLEQCAQRSLEVQRDPFGNLAAWWRPSSVGAPGEPVEPPGVLTGSHLDSVADGGAYDGPLGVVSALAAIDLLRDRGVRPARPLGVAVFAEEEGSRFGLACLGSRLATGSLPWARAAALTDRDGMSLEDAVADVELGDADLLAAVGCFVELHVEQGRDLVHRDVPVGVASGIWPHGRFRFEFTGEANHAGTTRMEDRHDPMLTYAMTALAANKQARLAGQRATFGRLEVHPNGTNAVPSRVTAWLDARAETSDELHAMLTMVERLAQDRAGRDGTALTVTPESVSPAVHFEESLARRIAGPGGLPVIPTMAGHDAGVLSAAGVPTAMLFVRNPTGVSHAPDEWAETADCLAGVEALADTLQELTPVTAYWLERAWTGAGPVQDGVRVEVEDGRFTDVRPGPSDGAERLTGLTVPGLANCHSHAFHRALRGRTQRGRGTFWTWREQMYAVAARLTPETYYELARATYQEMVSVGITTVGEFHYLHHGPDGTPYDDPNAMSHALLAAALDAGLRIALLDTCYLASGIGAPPEGVQVRFSDGDAERWAARAGALRLPAAEPGRPDAVLGAAIHSVRAVPREQLRDVAAGAERAPLHAHLSEQVAENEACLAAYGATPAEVLEEAGALGPRTSVVHATHLTARDVKVLGGTSTYACFCPTTERDLGDGVGPSRRLRDAGSTLTLGSDSHAVVDLFEEMRAVELDERLATQQRGHWTAEELLVAATGDGHRSLGFPDAGRIEVGARADLVTLDTSSVRTAGTGADAGTVVFAASGADVVRVVRDGVPVAAAEDRQAVGADLDRVIRALWEA